MRLGHQKLDQLNIMDLILLEIWYFLGLMCVDLLYCLLVGFSIFTFVSAALGVILVSLPVYADFFVEEGFERVMLYYRSLHDRFVHLMFQ
uniref:ORF7 protein n=1 Tax=Otomops bat coronavirus TaxID=3119329 RepID=A0AB38ZDR3_9NIDO